MIIRTYPLIVNAYKYSETSHSGHLRIMDTSESDGTIFAGIQPLHSGHFSRLYLHKTPL